MNRAPLPDLLALGRGDAPPLLGNVAIARGALEAGLQLFTCYPGTPSSEIGDTFARIHESAGLQFEYSVNEKVALEVAYGASLAGARTMCSMKHLGLNYAGDPAATIPYVGVEGGFVIVSAGDPSALTSPNEQDQRHFTKFLYYPVLDPATPQDALDMTRWGFELSEQTRLPVILRPTTRVCHTSARVATGALPERRNEIRFLKNPARHVPIPANARRMRRELAERYARAERMLAGSSFFPRTGDGPLGIVTSGVATCYVHSVVEELGLSDRLSILQIGGYPIPESIVASFLGEVERVLVVEELTPLVEEWLSLIAFRRGIHLPVLGKASGHLPVEFEYDPDLVEGALRTFADLPPRPATVPGVDLADLPPRPPVLCPGCPHRTSFLHGHRAFGKNTVYVNDIGCYTLGYGPPLDSCDVLLCMGSSITQASGIARATGERAVAYIGDSTFFHSGLPALANAVQAQDDIAVVVLNNYVTAMTGFQPSPTSCGLPGCEPAAAEPAAAGTAAAGAAVEASPDADRGLAIERAVRGLGVRNVYSVDPFDEKATRTAFRAAREDTGPSVVICNSPCVVDDGHRRTAPRPAYQVEQELCNACSLCVRVLGCPAILIEEGVYTIDERLCDGCRLCAEVCKRGAIQEVGSREQG